MSLPNRQDQKLPDCWDLNPLYTDDKSWDEDFKRVTSSPQPPFWPELHLFKGRLGDGVETVIEAFHVLYAIQRKLEKLFVYAHLRHDEEITEEGSKGRFAKIFSLYQQFGDERSWFEPELLALPEEQLKSYLKDKRLGDYRFPLEVIVHLKPHILDAQGEALLAKSEETLTTSHRAFKALTDADLVFPDVRDSQNQVHPLSHGSYTFYLRSSDRTLRKETFTTFHETFSKYKNTLAELYQGVVKNHHFQAKARGYKSCLEAALFPRNIPTAVYTALISAVREGIDVHHAYIDLRAKVMGVDKFHLYDGYAPLIEGVDVEVPYEEAVDLVIASVAPLGKDYQRHLLRV